MPSLKRKLDAPEISSSKHAHKRLRANAKSTVPTTSRDKVAAKTKTKSKSTKIQFRPKSTNSSLVANEQPAFPRGGADVLTPIERKQIQAQATRDAFKEHTKSQDLFQTSENLSDESEPTNGLQAPRTSLNLRKKTAGKGKVRINGVPEAPWVRIEGLSYKRISPGSLILGQISSINAHDLTVALPNNLIAYVPLTAISARLTEKIEHLLDAEANDQEKDASAEEEDNIRLSEYFHVGQYVRAAVTSVGDDSAEGASKARKRIKLSLDPRLSNLGLSRSSIVVGCTVQVSVSSVEDHGIVVDLGFDDEQTKGFIPVPELSPLFDKTKIQTGTVLLCLVTGMGANGRTIKLSASEEKFGSLSKSYCLSTAPNVASFLPGTAIEVLLSDVTESGLAGKVMGMLDVTADVVHSGAAANPGAIEKIYAPGSKIKGRLICTFPASEPPKLGFSVLEDVLSLRLPSPPSNSEQAISVSSVVRNAKVIRVEEGLGVYLDLEDRMGKGFAHISRLSDSRVDSIYESSGPFKVGSTHTGRVLDFNPMDNLFIMSLQEKVVQQPFLRVEDVKVGEIVKGKVEKLLLGDDGVKGLLVQLSEGVTGLVPQIHFSDVALQHPEKRFRVGLILTARVLSTDVGKGQIRLTLKKTLMNSEQKIWSDYHEVSVGDSCPGTLVKVDSHGALVQFYGSVKGFLPVAEMSEAYITDATQHFRRGQVVTVTAISIDSEATRLTVSCRDFSSSNVSLESKFATLATGTLVNGAVFEKSEDDILLRLETSDVIARLPLDHISDGSLRKRQAALAKIRVGQVLQDLLVLEVHRKRRLVTLCNRQSLIKALKDDRLLKGFEDLKEGLIVTGFVSNITSDGVFIGFAAGLSGLVPKGRVPKGTESEPDFGLKRLQTVSAVVSSIKYGGPVPRFWLDMRDGKTERGTPLNTSSGTTESQSAVVDPVDGVTKFIEGFSVGAVTKARIISVKDTQINVELGKGIQGRIDISEVFDGWENIKDRKQPLRSFSTKQVIPVRVLGAHDTRNHRFLPLTHRSGKTPVFELTAKPSLIKKMSLDILTLEQVKPGSSWLAFVNNVADDCLWVNISPTVRGRIRAIDVSDDLSLMADLEEHFPVGSALKVHVDGVDLEKARLDLSARKSGSAGQLTIKEISKGLVLPGRVTKSSDRQVLVQLSDSVVGAVDLIDMADDYSQAIPANYQKNDIARVCVVDVDIPNKKIHLSMRASKVLSSSLAIEDPEITTIDQLNVNDVYRGFVSNVTDKGLFVTIGHGLTAFVRVTNLSDMYLEEWKDHFQRDQLVKGKIIHVDRDSAHVQMSLKESMLKADYVAPLTYTDLKVGDIVTGKVANVKDFGVFIVVDNSANIRGLCHRSEIADIRVEDASKLFTEGDVVKAKVLKIELDKRRINFGLKASYFPEPDGEEEDDESAEGETEVRVSDGGVRLEADPETDSEASDGESGDSVDEDNPWIDDELNGVSGKDAESSSISDRSNDDEEIGTKQKTNPLVRTLSVGGFDWTGSASDASLKHTISTSDAEDETLTPKPKRKRRAEIQIDRTGDLDARGPQSVDDFERLLLGEPDSSVLWLQYMAFHLELGEFDRARQIGERAIKTIGLGQDAEKMNVWIALLNLENTYGDDESAEAMFRRACEYNDSQDIHARLTSIYIQSGKLDKADGLFQSMLRKFAQDPKIWINYATFLFDTVAEPDKARQLLPRALHTLAPFTHVDITCKFAQLEFRSSAGLPERGRTIFEGLLDSFPKRMDLWNVLIDLELRMGEKEQVRRLYERIFAGKVKNKPAKFFFKKWLAFEEKVGDERSVDRVKSRAAEFVRSAGGKSE